MEPIDLVIRWAGLSVRPRDGLDGRRRFTKDHREAALTVVVSVVGIAMLFAGVATGVIKMAPPIFFTAPVEAVPR